MLFQEMRNSNYELDIIAFNTLIDGTMKSGDIQSAKELLMEMLQMGLTPDAFTYSIIINRFSKLGQLEQAKVYFDRMISSGFKPSIHVYDSLLKGFGALGEMKEVINLLRQMADEKVVIDSTTTHTILNCLCYSSQGADIVKLLPNFAPEIPEGTSISCDELLMKIQECSPEFQVCPN